MEIVFLGTGAATPTLQRWPTSIAVVRARETLLFDCGEGAQVMFLRAHLKPGKLSRIFISHFHGDHFNGLIGLLTSLQLNGRDRPLSIYGPHGIAGYLDYMQKLSKFTFRFDVRLHEIPPDSKETTWNFKTYAVTAMPLEHRIPTYGFRLTEKPLPGKFDIEAAARLGIPDGPVRGLLQRGQSIELADGTRVAPSQVIGPERAGNNIAICTDTLPCENAVRLAQNADVLVHEGTFDVSKSEWAHETGHSTVGQAAQIAQQACVKKLVLTHISARYGPEDEPELLSQAQEIFPNSMIAHDMLRVEV